jgi:hypothetical protein
MKISEKQKMLRAIDANYNRCREGLRVVEDVFRFILQDDIFRKKIRVVRHSLDDIAKARILKEAILTRDSKKDLGKKVDNLELKRDSLNDIIYANLQRAKESLRVMEEFFKILIPNKVKSIKKIRYQLYTLEKQILLKKR